MMQCGKGVELLLVLNWTAQKQELTAHSYTSLYAFPLRLQYGLHSFTYDLNLGRSHLHSLLLIRLNIIKSHSQQLHCIILLGYALTVCFLFFLHSHMFSKELSVCRAFPMCLQSLGSKILAVEVQIIKNDIEHRFN